MIEKTKKKISEFFVIVIAIFMSITASETFLGDDFNEEVSKRIGEVVKSSIQPDLDKINVKLELFSNFIYEEKVKNIVKQADKIAKDPEDIKVADIRSAIDDWNIIPEKYKNPLLIERFHSVKTWASIHL